MLSDWLIQNIDLDNLYSFEDIDTPVKDFRAGSNTDIRARGYYSDYTEYSVYFNYSNYSNYSDSYSRYSRYSNYSNYSNTCSSTCQVCNTCMGKCETNQYAHYYVGHQMSFTDDLTYIKAQNLNDLIDYINAAAIVCNLPIDLTNSKVTASDIINYTSFNVINSAINQFIDGSTGYMDKLEGGSKTLREEMNQFKNILNNIKLSATIPCCQVSGYENCVSRQK